MKNNFHLFFITNQNTQKMEFENAKKKSLEYLHKKNKGITQGLLFIVFKLKA